MTKKFFNIILMATLISKMLTKHSVCHVGYFCYQDDGRDQNGNGFQFPGTKVGASKN